MSEEKKPLENQVADKINNLTPREARFVNLFALWLFIAGMWQSFEVVYVFVKWLFR